MYRHESAAPARLRALVVVSVGLLALAAGASTRVPAATAEPPGAPRQESPCGTGGEIAPAPVARVVPPIVWGDAPYDPDVLLLRSSDTGEWRQLTSEEVISGQTLLWQCDILQLGESGEIVVEFQVDGRTLASCSLVGYLNVVIWPVPYDLFHVQGGYEQLQFCHIYGGQEVYITFPASGALRIAPTPDPPDQERETVP